MRDAAEPFTGTADLEFRLFDQLLDGSQVGSTQNRPIWPVEDGLFQVDLDFGLAAFTEEVRYLEIRVDGTLLTPRQAIRPSPMALSALGDPEEMDFIGIEDLIGPHSVLLIEWPVRGKGRLPEPSTRIRIEHRGTGRRVSMV